jgi:hypothetical protein
MIRKFLNARIVVFCFLFVVCHNFLEKLFTMKLELVIIGIFAGSISNFGWHKNLLVKFIERWYYIFVIGIVGTLFLIIIFKNLLSVIEFTEKCFISSLRSCLRVGHVLLWLNVFFIFDLADFGEHFCLKVKN